LLRQLDRITGKHHAVDSQKDIEHTICSPLVAIHKWLVLGNANCHQHRLSHQVRAFVVGSRLCSHQGRLQQTLVSQCLRRVSRAHHDFVVDHHDFGNR
jgi:hypothetical protein